MKTKYLLTALAIVLSMTAGCTTAERAATATKSSDFDVVYESTESAEETNDVPTDSSLSDSEENIESESQNSVSVSEDDNMAVSADWAENVTDTVSDYDEYIIEDSEYAMSIMFTANNPVSNFKIVSLQYEDVKEDGTPVFLTEDVYTYGELKAERSLLIKLSFFGDMPHYGVIYTDDSGIEKHYALQQSGKDGSLIMFEFE